MKWVIYDHFLAFAGKAKTRKSTFGLIKSLFSITSFITDNAIENKNILCSQQLKKRVQIKNIRIFFVVKEKFRKLSYLSSHLILNQ